ncbi:putative fatty acyl-CoA reductase CG5065 [Contarinia nasturtii]|uniref:putative fatty acyl-CoA reductase CG5065 n=1 Tax=Contarinia nasturtii TaxID=265458 RepID=UPI0012D3C217|nr:putative fatty acyl-CoA reductase CG5065 [Contarinia nasturtii]
MGENPSESNIANWYRDQIIFITGATGFMGKVLVEKLLRDCPEVKTCYLLMRTKRGIEPEQRRDDYINHMIFDRIRESNPKQLEKIVVIKGDVSVDGLGMSENDRKLLIEKTTIVFHCAANVRFDQELTGAVNMNTLGTNRVLQLVIEMKQLKVFAHVSTAYCQCNEEVLEERAYAAPNDPLAIATLCKHLDNDILEYLTPKLLNGLPNTYAYTKALTEDLVNSYCGKIPIVIARPSIVTAAWKEPYPGWVEGMNGPTGLMVGAARGVVRSMHCNPDYPADILPVDVCMNAIITAAWERGLKYENKDVDFRNITLAHDKQMTWGLAVEKGREFFYENPLCFSLWYPDGSIKSNYWHHMFCVIFFHYLPAYLIDFLLVLMRRKPFLVGIQRRISQGLKVLQYYTTKNWTFKNEKFLRMKDNMSEKDKEIFYFSVEDVDWNAYIGHYILGARHYLLKEKPETLPKARTLLRRLYLLDRLVSVLFYGLTFWLIYSYWSNIIFSFENVLDKSAGLLYKRFNKNYSE